MENQYFIAKDLNGNYVNFVTEIVGSREEASSYFLKENALVFNDTNTPYILEQVCTRNCSNNGVCRNAKCVCQAGWEGDGCDIPSNKNCVCDCSTPLPVIPSVPDDLLPDDLLPGDLLPDDLLPDDLLPGDLLPGVPVSTEVMQYLKKLKKARAMKAYRKNQAMRAYSAKKAPVKKMLAKLFGVESDDKESSNGSMIINVMIIIGLLIGAYFLYKNMKKNNLLPSKNRRRNIEMDQF